jgi:type I restriction enzyme R subunit
MVQARTLRAKMTPAERAMWKLLRGRGFEGHKFRRQTQIGPWVADFCCYEPRLVIELDGGIHRLREAEDAARDADLRRRGFTVLRFGNEAVLTNPNVVFDAVRLHVAHGQPPHPSGSA